jgi:hypothetical protein
MGDAGGVERGERRVDAGFAEVVAVVRRRAAPVADRARAARSFTVGGP